jgi:hypothetical protein
MKTHWDFFKESDTSFGMFYPRHYIVAGFDNLDHAEAAEQALVEHGIAPDDVRAASGSFVVNRLESTDDAGLIERFKMHLAKSIGTESGYIDDDIKLARRGGAFLFAHAPTDEDCQRIMTVLRRHHPIFARRYLPLAIERLIYPAQTMI